MQTNNKLREALKLAKSSLDGYGNINDLELRRKVDAALAEPIRNCEVGTAEEQADRFFDFCDGYHYATGYKNCGTCPLWVSGTVGHDCELRWSQMLYEEQKEINKS